MKFPRRAGMCWRTPFTFFLKPQPKPTCFLVDGHCSTRSSSHHNNTTKCYPCWTYTCNWNPIFTSCSVEDTSSKWSTFSQSSYVCSTRVEYEFLHRSKSKRDKHAFNLTKSELESAEMTFTYHRRKTKQRLETTGMNAYFMSLQQTKYQHNLPNTKLVVSICDWGCWFLELDAPPTQNTGILGAKVVSTEETPQRRGDQK